MIIEIKKGMERKNDLMGWPPSLVNINDEGCLCFAVLNKEDIEDCQDTVLSMASFPREWRLISRLQKMQSPNSEPVLASEALNSMAEMASDSVDYANYANYIYGESNKNFSIEIEYLNAYSEQGFSVFRHEKSKVVVEVIGYNVNLGNIKNIITFNSSQDFFKYLGEKMEKNTVTKFRVNYDLYPQSVDAFIRFLGSPEKDEYLYDPTCYMYDIGYSELVNEIRENAGMKSVKNPTYSKLMKTLFLILKRNPDVIRRLRNYFHNSILLISPKGGKNFKGFPSLEKVAKESNLSFDFLSSLDELDRGKILAVLIYVWGVCFERYRPHYHKIIKKDAPLTNVLEKSSELDFKRLPLLGIVKNTYDF